MLRSALKNTLEGVLAGAVLMGSAGAQPILSISDQGSKVNISANQLSTGFNYDLLSSSNIAADFSGWPSKTNFDASSSSYSFSFSKPSQKEYFVLRENTPDTRLKIRSLGKQGNNMSVEAVNLIPGNYYSITSKTNITDAFEPHARKNTFEATSSKMTFSFPANKSVEFLSVVDLDSYVGPDISAVSPAQDQVVSGNVAINFFSRDIFPYTVEGYVEDSAGAYDYLGLIEEGGQNFSFNSQTFANGPARIYLIAKGKKGIAVEVPDDPDDPGDSPQQSEYFFENYAIRDVVISNNIFASEYSKFSPKGGGFNFRLLSTDPSFNEDYQLKVSDYRGNILSTSLVDFVNGEAFVSWDGSSNGFPVDLYKNRAAIDVVPIASSASGRNKNNKNGGPIIMNGGGGGSGSLFSATNFFSNGPQLKPRYFVTQKWPSATVNQINSDIVYSLYDMTQWAALIFQDREPISRGVYVWGINPVIINQANQHAYRDMIVNTITNRSIGGVHFNTHGGPESIIHGIDEYITAFITRKEIGDGLGNNLSFTSITGDDGKKIRELDFQIENPIFESWFFACSCAKNNGWSIAMGVPDVDYLTNTGLAPRTFFAFRELGNINNTWKNFATYMDQRWVSDVPVIECVNSTVNRYPKSLVWGPTQYGHPFVKYGRGNTQ